MLWQINRRVKPALGAKWRLGGVPMGLNSVVIYCYLSFVVGVLRCDWR